MYWLILLLSHVVIEVDSENERTETFPIKRSDKIERNHIEFDISKDDWADYDFAPETFVNVKPLSGALIDVNSDEQNKPKSIIKDDWNFENMGIGGLSEEFLNIFKKAILPRINANSGINKCGVQPVKGILIHGPLDTGKTLVARKIKEMVIASEVTIVNGPEILNKFVGESNIRNLFENAERESKEKGSESGLHIIIFDEIDAICKSRGSPFGNTNVFDTIVNQLLCYFDGVE
ncbi:vesicle-fusing ATPase-like protein, partial [Leptotrombidium deliense]